MVYKRISIAVLVLISSMQSVVLAEHEFGLTDVNRELIDQHAERFKNWEKTRESRQNLAFYSAVLLGLGYVGYRGYSWWNPMPAAAENIGPHAVQADLVNLAQRVLVLEGVPKDAADDVSWLGWGAGLIKSGFGKGFKLGCGFAAYIASQSVVRAGSSMIQNSILRSPFAAKVSALSDYIMRPRTLVWLLEEECALRPALQNLKKIQDAKLDILRKDPTYENRLVTGTNTLVREVEKVVAHMAFIKEYIADKESYQAQNVDEAMDTITFQLNWILQSTENFLNDCKKGFVSMENFLKVVGSYNANMWSALDAIFEQMQFFGIVQTAVGFIDVSSDSCPLEQDLKSMRAILKPLEYGDNGEEIDRTEEETMKLLKETLISEGVDWILSDIGSSFSSNGR